MPIQPGSGDGVLSSVTLGNDHTSKVLFLLTFASSIVSGGFGCTKALHVGVAAIMGDDGPLEGLCTGRFIVACFGKTFNIDSVYINGA